MVITLDAIRKAAGFDCGAGRAVDLVAGLETLRFPLSWPAVCSGFGGKIVTRIGSTELRAAKVNGNANTVACKLTDRIKKEAVVIVLAMGRNG
jgi:hypothetical protein